MTTAPRFGPAVAVDPELGMALQAVLGRMSQARFPADPIEKARRISQAARPSLEELGRGGTFDVTERRVPGPAGGPDIDLVVCLPVGAGPAGPGILMCTAAEDLGRQ